MPPSLPVHYVAIGASAGGLEAIEAFFKDMPTDTGLAFILVQHLSPDYKSMMLELLANRTEIPVFRAEDNLEVRANSIYLIPPRKNLTIFHGKLLLKEQERSGGISLPIDIFFKSLAEDQGEKSIGVILSGTGSDGTRGARAIKEVGGMVMVQTEESAKFDGMPRSVIATGLADFILAPEEMHTQLQAYSKHPYANQPKRGSVLLSDEDRMTRIFSLLRERSRIDFTFYKPSTVVRRIERRMMVNQLHDLPEYVHYLEGNPVEVDVLYQDLLISVTNFMRDPVAFDAIEQAYIPELLGRDNVRQIRVWVAGCATGEEAYSLAILFREAMERRGKLFDVKIFATDVDQSALERASSGLYPEGIVTDLPANLLAKYFIHRDDRFQISRTIREMVVFAQHNVLKDPPFTNIDLISCRNVLIYLQPVLQRKVLELFNFSLNPHGILFLGTSETIGEMSEFFEPVDTKWRIYRSRGRRRPPSVHSEVAALLPGGTRIRSTGSGGGAGPQDERILDRFLQSFTGDYVDMAILVNADLELLHAVGETQRYLRVAPGVMSSDISKLMPRELSIPLSNGVQKVIKTGVAVVFSNIRLQLDGIPELLRMRIKPVPQKRGQDPLAAVFLELQARENGEQDVTISQNFDVSAESQQRINDLESELQFSRENLQATVEELETSNEELQATNEELLASNEELQSTNEELQSVNEELYTVNAEYQSKITELTELTNDLDNLLDNTEIGTLFLDENLDIRRFSPRVTELFKIIESDVGRSIFDIAHNLEGVVFKVVIDEVLQSNRVSEYEVRSRDDWYLMRILPYRIASNLFAGVVVLFININQSKAAQLEAVHNQQRHSVAVRAAGMGIWEWDIRTGELLWSKPIYAMFGRNAATFVPTLAGFLEQVHPEDRDRVSRAINDAISKGADYLVQHRVVWPDGAVRWMQEYGEVITDEAGEPLRMIGAVQDISGRKAMEHELRTSRQLVQNLLEAIPIPFYYKDTDGVYLNCNEALVRFLGVERDKIIGRRVDEVWPAEVTARYREMEQRLAACEESGVQVFEGVMPHADGTLHPVEFHKALFRNPDGSTGGLIVAVVELP